ncbi:MAG: DUF5666 domain-containing protein [Acidobacteriota bacterium]
MVDKLFKIMLSIALAVLFNVAIQPDSFSQAPQGRRGSPPNFDPAKQLAGKVVEISGNTFKVKNREDEELTFTVTDKTVYAYNREAATLSAFKTDDFVMALGARDANGQFVAERVMGGDRPPMGPPGGRGGRFNGVGGEVTAIDAATGTITVKNFQGDSQTILVTAQTTFNRNRQSATLADFKVGDHARAEGAKNDSGQFVATRIFGGDQKPGK